MPTNNKTLQIEPEGGVTEISLNNAKVLIKEHGVPIKLNFHADKKKCDYFVRAEWRDGFSFCFSGFAWGYGGTGPRGLLKFFHMAHVWSIVPDDLPIDKFGKTDATWNRYNIKDEPCVLTSPNKNSKQ